MPENFTFKPIEARLIHDTDFITKMNPYCVFVIEGKRINSQVCKRGGKHPSWNDIVTIPVNNESKVLVELMDKDRITSDDKIGYFIMDLQETISQGKTSKWYSLSHKNKHTGEILIESTFQNNTLAGEGIEANNLFKKETLENGSNKQILASQKGGKTFLEQRQEIKPHILHQNVDGVVLNPIVMQPVSAKNPEECGELRILTEIATKTVGPTAKNDSFDAWKNSKIFDAGNKDIVDERIKEMMADFHDFEHEHCEFKKY